MNTIAIPKISSFIKLEVRYGLWHVLLIASSVILVNLLVPIIAGLLGDQGTTHTSIKGNWVFAIMIGMFVLGALSAGSGIKKYPLAGFSRAATIKAWIGLMGIYALISVIGMWLTHGLEVLLQPLGLTCPQLLVPGVYNDKSPLYCGAPVDTAGLLGQFNLGPLLLLSLFVALGVALAFAAGFSSTVIWKRLHWFPALFLIGVLLALPVVVFGIVVIATMMAGFAQVIEFLPSSLIITGFGYSALAIATVLFAFQYGIRRFDG